MKNNKASAAKIPTGYLWVVECQYSNYTWGPCWFTELDFVNTNYYQAHVLKRALIKRLVTPDVPHWVEKRFRVKPYERKIGQWQA